MNIKRSNLYFAIFFVLVLIAGYANISYAALSMDEVRFLFQKEKGKPWKDATPEEQKSFLSDVRGRDEYQEGEYKHLALEKKEEAQNQEIGSIIEQREPKTKFAIRTSFEIETGIAWEDASEKEQKEYIRKYNLRKQKEKAETERNRQKKIREEKERERLYRAKKDKARRQEELRKQRAKQKLEETRRRREESKRRDLEAKRKLRELKRRALNRR